MAANIWLAAAMPTLLPIHQSINQFCAVHVPLLIECSSLLFLLLASQRLSDVPMPRSTTALPAGVAVNGETQT
jgi:hypothetical protein